MSCQQNKEFAPTLKSEHDLLTEPNEPLIFTFDNRTYIGLLCPICPRHQESCNLEHYVKEFQATKTNGQTFSQWADTLRRSNFSIEMQRMLYTNEKKNVL